MTDLHTGMAAPFAVNPDCVATVIYVGADKEPVLIIDDLLLDPEALVRYAELGAPFRKEEKDFYPGIRKLLSMDYAQAIHDHLQQVFLDTFSGGRPASIVPLSSLLSVTSTAEEDLRPIQSVPHFDSFDPTQIAGVHYLCPATFGGTAFYRHRSTGFESMNAARLAQYAPQLKREVMDLKATSFRYIRGDTTLFERTACVEAKFNRAIYYRSNILHSGDMAADVVLPPDPRTGRLTANTLALVRPRD